MNMRLRLLRGATALLYFGPLLAGLGGFGWGVVPIFACIFLLWLFILRPRQWPRTAADWSRPEALIALLTQGVMQVLLVAVSFGIGRGIGGVLNVLPAFPLMLPVAISFLSIPLARLIWDPWAAGAPDEAEMALVEGAQVDDIQARIEAGTRMVAALDRLPAETAPEVLVRHLQAMAPQVSHKALRVALMDPIHEGTASPLLRRAAVVHATETEAADELSGSGYPLAVFHTLTTADQLALFADRCAGLVATGPGRAVDCPEPDEVLAAARRMPDAAGPLTALAAALRAAAERAK